MNNFKIIIASLPDEEQLVAEIYFMNKYWARISQEPGQFIIKFYSDHNCAYWEFGFDEAINILNEAKKKLTLGKI